MYLRLQARNVCMDAVRSSHFRWFLGTRGNGYGEAHKEQYAKRWQQPSMGDCVSQMDLYPHVGLSR